MVVETVVVALWAMGPAYIPNNAAVLAGGGAPIDGGRTMGDRRLLGDGKTWRGTGVGIVAGVAVAYLLNLVAPTVEAVGYGVPTFTPVVAFALAAGAMLGDILASFVKRRTGRERGTAFPLLDQLDFVVVSLGLVALLAPGWFTSVFTLPRLLVVLVATPLLHLLTNAGAYALGLKAEPW
ncbi:CDP-2,3-bis-(O-geranylgeranyl)-sn-glycerol synthase [Natronomonas sp. EA1]|uniref:CDP-2,3-bis-(O-geranylgeranyl)-sn-glycerol synthase n=1 Tax=Natronomonas sp. EA1 TaxID=3421655 RepID=UPI003EBB5981